MAEAENQNGTQLTTADGKPLKVSLRRAERRNKLKAVGLVMPLFLFIFITFIVPILMMLYRSAENLEVVTYLDDTVAVIEQWAEGSELPPEPVWAALANDLREAGEAREIGKVATRLNYEEPGFRSLIMKSSRMVRRVDEPVDSWMQTLIDIDEDWTDPVYWHVIKQQSGAFTISYYLSAIDMQREALTGEIVMAPEYKQIYQLLFWRTLWMSALITGLTVVLGFPVAFLLANLPMRKSNLLMIFVLLPFWTSLLVRTSTWIAILQTEGVLNDVLVWAGVIADEARIQMIYNKTGTIVAMTHILLPFMILPLYSVMKTISPAYMRAARSLGANPVTAFVRVYIPQTIPGVGAGGILVFILAIGYYITPALVGGRGGQLISNYIAYHMQQSLNWGLAAAIATILLAGVMALYLLYNRIVGIDNMKLG